MKTSACPEIPRLDPRVQRTRKLIEDAFRALLTERSYGEISVGDVASRATINRNTFYAHFENKEHLATAILQGDLDTALRTRLTHGMPLNAETLTGVAEAVFEFFGSAGIDCHNQNDALGQTLMTTLQETIQALIRRWLDLDGEAMRAFPGAKKDEVATIIAWGLYGGAQNWIRLNRLLPAGDAARRIAALLIR